jgi:hypothetical protein
LTDTQKFPVLAFIDIGIYGFIVIGFVCLLVFVARLVFEPKSLLADIKEALTSSILLVFGVFAIWVLLMMWILDLF